jgi:hypothetical protein
MRINLVVDIETTSKTTGFIHCDIGHERAVVSGKSISGLYRGRYVTDRAQPNQFRCLSIEVCSTSLCWTNVINFLVSTSNLSWISLHGASHWPTKIDYKGRPWQCINTKGMLWLQGPVYILWCDIVTALLLWSSCLREAQKPTTVLLEHQYCNNC